MQLHGGFVDNIANLVAGKRRDMGDFKETYMHSPLKFSSKITSNNSPERKSQSPQTQSLKKSPFRSLEKSAQKSP